MAVFVETGRSASGQLPNPNYSFTHMDAAGKEDGLTRNPTLSGKYEFLTLDEIGSYRPNAVHSMGLNPDTGILQVVPYVEKNAAARTALLDAFAKQGLSIDPTKFDRTPTEFNRLYYPDGAYRTFSDHLSPIKGREQLVLYFTEGVDRHAMGKAVVALENAGYLNPEDAKAVIQAESQRVGFSREQHSTPVNNNNLAESSRQDNDDVKVAPSTAEDIARQKGEIIKTALQYPGNQGQGAYHIAETLDNVLKEQGFDSHLLVDLRQSNEGLTFAQRENGRDLQTLQTLMQKNGIPADAIERTSQTINGTNVYQVDGFSSKLPIHPEHPDNLPAPSHAGAAVEAGVESSVSRSQAGRADVRVLGATAALMGLASAGAKAALTHALPVGVEAVMQGERVAEVLELAQKNLENGQLTQAQFNIISDINNKTLAAASLASAAPDPSGLATSDQAVRQGDQMLVNALVKTGISPEQAQQYELGSLAGALDKGAALVVDSLSNAKEVQQLMASSGQVPLSMALGLTQDQLKQTLGPMAEKLGGKALHEEIARNPVLDKLATMSPDKLNLLGQLVLAGKDPKVSVDAEGNISALSQRPVLPADSKMAIKVAAEYFANSGDYGMRASPKDPPAVQVAVKRLGEMYAHLAQNDGLSKNDIQALSQATEMLANTVGLSQQAQNDTRHQPAPAQQAAAELGA